MESGVLSPSSVELNLLLEWPDQRTRPQWVLIFGASIALHLILFAIGIRIPSLINAERRPERNVVVRRIPLYLPRDVMTQKAPNRDKVSKQIDLADLQDVRPGKPSPGRRAPSIRRFEMPKQAAPRQMAKTAQPRILPPAPVIEPPDATSGAGIPNGLPTAAPPPRDANQHPFQNIGEAAAPDTHPKITPPQPSVSEAINELTQSSNNRHLVISDDVPPQSMPLSPGSTGQAPAQHAAVELQSDPNGADFKAYLRTILTIVRTNWRRVVPESARMGMLRGRSVVEFIIDRDGGIPKLVVADSSGSDPLDRAAIAGLSMSNPLPPLPADYKGIQVRLAFTFAYNMPSR